MTTKDHNLQSLGDIIKGGQPGSSGLFAQLPTHIKSIARTSAPLSRVQNRLLEPCSDSDFEVCFQHSVLCQTGLPYRNPGDEVRLWEREQGNVTLRIEAGAIPDPASGKYVDVSLPWGTKPRLILAHLNAEALRQGSPEIDIEGSLSAFVKRVRGFATGREIRMFKYQLACLSTGGVPNSVVTWDGDLTPRC
jgi:hypothetical protein